MKNVIDFTKFFSYREREAAEVDRLRNMTEEERRLESKMNPKKISNKGNFAQCGNLAILLSLRFYVKSIDKDIQKSGPLELSKMAVFE